MCFRRGFHDGSALGLLRIRPLGYYTDALWFTPDFVFELERICVGFYECDMELLRICVLRHDGIACWADTN